MVDRTHVAEQEAADLPDRDPHRKLRVTILLTILGVLVLALWYDYRVARPHVEDAYNSVMRENFRVNATAASRPMTAADVQVIIGRPPIRVFRQGPYQVEVYRWVAGLPFRSHDYFAVYLGQGPGMSLMRHYMFTLPLEELSPPRGRVVELPPELAAALQEYELNAMEEYGGLSELDARSGDLDYVE